MKKTVVLIVLFSGFAVCSSAQSTASATASATLIVPISILKNVNMDFGNVAASGTPGTVLLTPAGTRTATGGVTLPAITGTVSAADFTVTGAINSTYSITLPLDGTITIISGSNSMPVNTFTSDPSGTGTTNGTLGTEDLTVGATLIVSAAQPGGTYTGTFNVTVNYN